MEAIEMSYENQRVYRKSLSSLVCDKMVLQKWKNLRSVTETHYLCIFSKSWNSQQADELYNLLKTVPEVILAKDIKFKSVGPLFVFGNSKKFQTSQRTRVYFDHPCISVKSDQELQNCMNFWDQYVFENPVLPTQSMLVRSSNQVLTILMNLSRWNSKWSESKVKKTDSVLGVEYIAIQQEYLSEMTLNYYTINKGSVVWPKFLFSVDLSKIEIVNIKNELIQLSHESDSVKAQANPFHTDLEFEALYQLVSRNIFLGELPDSRLDLSSEYLEIILSRRLEEDRSLKNSESTIKK